MGFSGQKHHTHSCAAFLLLGEDGLCVPQEGVGGGTMASMHMDSSSSIFFSPYDLTMYPYVSIGNLIVVCLVYLVPPGLPAGATQGSWKTFLSVGEGVPQPKLPNCLWLGQGTMKLPGPDYLL